MMNKQRCSCGAEICAADCAAAMEVHQSEVHGKAAAQSAEDALVSMSPEQLQALRVRLTGLLPQKAGALAVARVPSKRKR